MLMGEKDSGIKKIISEAVNNHQVPKSVEQIKHKMALRRGACAENRGGVAGLNRGSR